VPGALLLRLLVPADVALGECAANGLAAVPVDDVNLIRPEAPGRCQNVPEQRYSGDAVEHFRQVGIHALALTGGEHDD